MGLLGKDKESVQPPPPYAAIDWPTLASPRLRKPILKMPEKIPTKPFREKIVDAIAAEGGILSPGDSVQTVSDKMVALDTNILPVSEDGRLVALADKPNPGLDASSHGHDPKTTRISETMNRDIVFCHEDDDCAAALRKMEERKLSHLPVVDREMRMVGLVAREDLNARIGKADADNTAVGTVGSPVALNTNASASPAASKQT